MPSERVPEATVTSIRVPVEGRLLRADLGMPPKPQGLVLFAHGSGSGRLSPRNCHVARALEHRGIATLLVDLLTTEEEAIDARTAKYRFDVARLADRLTGLVDWFKRLSETGSLRMGLFGASTGAAAALVAASQRTGEIQAVVLRGGRSDMAGAAIGQVLAPTLFIVGGRDSQVVEINRAAVPRLGGPVALEIVPGATHLFPEPGTLDRVAELAGDWFMRYLVASGRASAPPGHA